MALDHNSAPFLAQKEEQRGDNLAAVIVDLAAAGRDTSLHQMAARDAYGNAAKYGEQPR
jgi:hypothetical protein